MVNRVEERFGIKPQRLIGDTAYGTAAMLNWIVETKQIEPHTPVWQKYEGTAGLFGMADFTWDAEAGFPYHPFKSCFKFHVSDFPLNQHSSRVHGHVFL